MIRVEGDAVTTILVAVGYKEATGLQWGIYGNLCSRITNDR